MKVIRTVADYQTFVDALPKIGDNIEGISIRTRAALLTPEEVAKLNEWGAVNMKAAVVIMDKDMAEHLGGLKEVKEGEHYTFAIKSKKEGKGKATATYYLLENNKGNRPFSEGRVGDGQSEGYLSDMLNGLWTISDPGIIDATGVITSLQHRCISYLKAVSMNPELPAIPVVVLFGLPPQFGDNVDKGKTRTPSDREYRDSDQFTKELIATAFNWEQGYELPPADLDKLRKSMSSEIVTVCNYVYCRLSGNNVHATKKVLPSERQRLRFQEAFGGRLQQLIAELHAAASDGENTLYWTKTFALPIVATGIVLASNRELDPLADPSTEAGNLSIDEEIVQKTISWLKESNGENDLGFSPAIKDINDAKKKIKAVGGTAPNAKEIMACFVNAHTQLLDNGAVTQKVWAGSKDRKKAEKEQTYPIYGGADQGRKQEESDE